MHSEHSGPTGTEASTSPAPTSVAAAESVRQRVGEQAVHWNAHGRSVHRRKYLVGRRVRAVRSCPRPTRHMRLLTTSLTPIYLWVPYSYTTEVRIRGNVVHSEHSGPTGTKPPPPSPPAPPPPYLGEAGVRRNVQGNLPASLPDYWQSSTRRNPSGYLENSGDFYDTFVHTINPDPSNSVPLPPPPIGLQYSTHRSIEFGARVGPNWYGGIQDTWRLKFQRADVATRGHQYDTSFKSRL